MMAHKGQSGGTSQERRLFSSANACPALVTGAALVKPLNAPFEYITSRLDFMIAESGDVLGHSWGAMIKGLVTVQRTAYLVQVSGLSSRY